MLILSLFWLLVGLFLAILANSAHLWPTSWGRMQRWLALLGIGALATLAGGWLGTLMLGRSVATAVALWVGALCVVGIPWIVKRYVGNIGKRAKRA